MIAEVTPEIFWAAFAAVAIALGSLGSMLVTWMAMDRRITVLETERKILSLEWFRRHECENCEGNTLRAKD